MCRDFGKGRQGTGISFDGDDLACAFRQQCAGQAAGAWADFDNGCRVERCSGAGDAAGEIEIKQEVLAE